MHQAVANMGQRSECNLADMKQVSQFTKANGPGILVWDFRAQLALPEQLSCNSVLCPSAYPMSQKHGYECGLYVAHAVESIVYAGLRKYSHAQMQGGTARRASNFSRCRIRAMARWQYKVMNELDREKAKTPHGWPQLGPTGSFRLSSLLDGNIQMGAPHACPTSGTGQKSFSSELRLCCIAMMRRQMAKPATWSPGQSRLLVWPSLPPAFRSTWFPAKFVSCPATWWCKPDTTRKHVAEWSTMPSRPSSQHLASTQPGTWRPSKWCMGRRCSMHRASCADSWMGVAKGMDLLLLPQWAAERAKYWRSHPRSHLWIRRRPGSITECSQWALDADCITIYEQYFQRLWV